MTPVVSWFLVIPVISCGFSGLRWALLAFPGLLFPFLAFSHLSWALLAFAGFCWVLTRVIIAGGERRNFWRVWARFLEGFWGIWESFGRS